MLCGVCGTFKNIDKQIVLKNHVLSYVYTLRLNLNFIQYSLI